LLDKKNSEEFKRRNTQPKLSFPLQPNEHNDNLLAKVTESNDGSVSENEQEEENKDQQSSPNFDESAERMAKKLAEK